MHTQPHPKPHTQPHHHAHHAYTLILALTITALLLTLTTTLTIFLTHETQLQTLSTDKAQARQNAKNALYLAIAHLQQDTGRDQTATAPDPNTPPNTAHWTYAQSTDPTTHPNTPRPLVSGYLQNDTLTAPYGWTTFTPEPPDHPHTPTTPKYHPTQTAWMSDTPPPPPPQNQKTNTNTTHPTKTQTTQNRYAYWIEDESQKADAGSTEPPWLTELPPQQQQLNQQLNLTRINLDNALNTQRPNQTSWRQNLAQALDHGWLQLAWQQTAPPNTPNPLHPALHTPASRGILANTNTGGLRINLDQQHPNPLQPNQLPHPKEIWDDHITRTTPHTTTLAKDPTQGLPISTPTTPFPLRRFPILTYLRIKIGIFHTHNDAYNRLRYHIEAQFWNPYPFPLTIPEKDMLALLDLETGPTIKIQNLNTGKTTETDTTNLPTGKFNNIQQTPSDTTLNAALLFTNTPHPNLPTQGLYPGENYRFHMPDPKTQPQGLARTLSPEKWYWQADPKKPNTPPTSATNNNWLHPTHTIQITATTPPQGLTIQIRQANGKLTPETHPKNYSQPILTLKNLHFQKYTKNIPATQFDRPDSTSYTNTEARIAYTLRLQTNNPTQLTTALQTIDPRTPTLDFDNPAIANLYHLTQDPTETLNQPPPTNHTQDTHYDTQENTHTTTTPNTPPYADFRTYDHTATTQPISLATLRHIPLPNTPAGPTNPKYPQNREQETTWFDRAFFAGTWPNNQPPTPTTTTQTPWTRNPWLEAIPDPTQPTTHDPRGNPQHINPNLAQNHDTAAHCFQRGALNINTQNPDPWDALLARTIPNWTRQTLQTTPQTNNPSPNKVLCPPFMAGTQTTTTTQTAPITLTPLTTTTTPKSQTLHNTLIRLPHNLHHPTHPPNTSPDLPDDQLRTAPDPIYHQAQATQGHRSLEPTTRKNLATQIATLIRQHHATTTPTQPIQTLSQFAQSPILQTAIEKSNINKIYGPNRNPSPLSALNINPGDILEATLPALTTRGDTYKIHARGTLLTPTGHPLAHATLEATLQRYPDFFDPQNPPHLPLTDPTLLPINHHLGRRYRLLHLRWLPPTTPPPP